MVEREQLAVTNAPNEAWSMNFTMETLSSGRRQRYLTIVNDFTEEAINIVVDYGISGLYVVGVLDQTARFRSYPKAVRTNQGPEFTSRILDQWAYVSSVALKLIQAGNRRKMPSLSHLMASVEMNVSMSTGSSCWRRRVL